MTRKVWADEALSSPVDRLVMLALAHCYNPAHGCFPAIHTISEMTSATERSVYRIVARLEKISRVKKVEGWLKREKPAKSTKQKRTSADQSKKERKSREEQQLEKINELGAWISENVVTRTRKELLRFIAEEGFAEPEDVFDWFSLGSRKGVKQVLIGVKDSDLYCGIDCDKDELAREVAEYKAAEERKRKEAEERKAEYERKRKEEEARLLEAEAKKLQDAPYFPIDRFSEYVEWIWSNCDCSLFEWADINHCAQQNGWVIQDKDTGDVCGVNSVPSSDSDSESIPFDAQDSENERESMDIPL